VISVVVSEAATQVHLLCSFIVVFGGGSYRLSLRRAFGTNQ